MHTWCDGHGNIEAELLGGVAFLWLRLAASIKKYCIGTADLSEIHCNLSDLDAAAGRRTSVAIHPR